MPATTQENFWVRLARAIGRRVPALEIPDIDETNIQQVDLSDPPDTICLHPIFVHWSNVSVDKRALALALRFLQRNAAVIDALEIRNVTFPSNALEKVLSAVSEGLLKFESNHLSHCVFENLSLSDSDWRALNQFLSHQNIILSGLHLEKINLGDRMARLNGVHLQTQLIYLGLVELGIGHGAADDLRALLQTLDIQFLDISRNPICEQHFSGMENFFRALFSKNDALQQVAVNSAMLNRASQMKEVVKAITAMSNRPKPKEDKSEKDTAAPDNDPKNKPRYT